MPWWGRAESAPSGSRATSPTGSPGTPSFPPLTSTSREGPAAPPGPPPPPLQGERPPRADSARRREPPAIVPTDGRAVVAPRATGGDDGLGSLRRDRSATSDQFERVWSVSIDE